MSCDWSRVSRDFIVRIVKYHWASRKFETDSTAARNDQDMANGPEEDSIALARANM